MKAKENTTEQLRKLVIQGCHPGKTWENALLEELYFGCGIIFETEEEELTTILHCVSVDGSILWAINKDEFNRGDIKQILGLPITLGRVLQALIYKWKTEQIVAYDRGNIVLFTDCSDGSTLLLDDTHWLLTKDGRECTIEDQSEETVSKLIELLK